RVHEGCAAPQGPRSLSIGGDDPGELPGRGHVLDRPRDLDPRSRDHSRLRAGFVLLQRDRSGPGRLRPRDLRPTHACGPASPSSVEDRASRNGRQPEGRERGVKAVILAGGMGTRISEETQVRPKPMVEIGGRPILWHIMKVYAHHGVREFIVCLGYKGYVIKEYFANYFVHNSDVTFHLAENR